LDITTKRAGGETGSPQQVQIMYGVGGERWLPELTVPWLSGYENSSPARIGNAAHEQLQLDVLGEVADAMFQALKSGMQPPERGRALRRAGAGSPRACSRLIPIRLGP